ncbi:MAG TPA: FKBP-type peptidyl-prolyl cis-trans isomerase [Solirubrobacterales bacterium]|nr:FKBP-type peptidyl-prolyl cis-trans isomerase [Solirubrobacterales bacterium]
MPHRKLIGLLALAALAFGACGSDSTPDPDPEPYRVFDYKPPPRSHALITSDGTELMGPELKPVIPDRPPPRTLVLEDLIQGVGAVAEAGSEISIQYAGYDYDSGRKLFSSWDQGKPTTLELGSGAMPEGIEEGLLEMQLADRREMVIPPQLTRGQGLPGRVPRGSHLVFVVELLAVG